MIPEIGIGNIGVGNVGVGDLYVNPPYVESLLYIAESNLDWMVNPPSAIPPSVPVTVEIGNPIVNMPGCVETNKENIGRPPNENQSLVNDDPNQNVVLCDGQMPAYAPMDYDTRKLKIETIVPPPDEEEYQHRGGYNGGAGGAGAVGEPPDTKQPDPLEDPPCPGPNAPRIGDVAQNQTEKVSGFELQVDPRNPDGVKICVILYEDIGAVEQFLTNTTGGSNYCYYCCGCYFICPTCQTPSRLAPEGCETCCEESDWEGSEDAWEEGESFVSSGKKVEAEGSECWCESCPSVEGEIVC